MNEYLPLQGIRICDFTAVWAGQTASMYLADLGAECIKVENPYIWNPMTRAVAPRITPAMAQVLPPWPGGHPPGDLPRPWNSAPGFIHLQRNKKSFTVDSRRPEGLEIVKALIQSCDVIADNLAPGTLTKIGLSDEQIRAVRPDIVILHMPAFGLSGDFREGRGYGSHIDSVAGSTVLRGYADSSPDTNVSILAGDFFNGMHGAIALLAALRHRRRTGEGQTIELAQVETSIQMFPQAALDAAWNGRSTRTVGNRSIEGFVPNGVFPCSGEDSWIAISCRNDAEWAALVEFMGRPAWATAATLGTAAGRLDAEDEIESNIATWTRAQDRDHLFHALQAAGVTAGPVLPSNDAANDPHLAATGAWQELPATADYPATLFARPPYHFSMSDVSIRSAPALFAQHNEYVYREVLGLTDAEIAKLTAEGHVRERYDDSIAGPVE